MLGKRKNACLAMFVVVQSFHTSHTYVCVTEPIIDQLQNHMDDPKTHN